MVFESQKSLRKLDILEPEVGWHPNGRLKEENDRPESTIQANKPNKEEESK